MWVSVNHENHGKNWKHRVWWGQLKTSPWKRRSIPTLTSRSRHTNKKESFKRSWRFWQLRTWHRYLSANNTTVETSIDCMNCGKKTYLEADHVVPRSNFRGDNWSPDNGQILCSVCTAAKGSDHGPWWDYRPKGYKVFQKALAAKEWEHDPITANPLKRWTLIGGMPHAPSTSSS